MTKKEIVKQISDNTGVPQLKTKEIVQQTFDAIIQTLITENRIELRNFGVFEVKLRKARKARNPRTGDQVFVEPKNVVTFQPGKEMEERVRDMALVEEKPRQTRKARGAAPAPAMPASAPPTVAATDGALLPAPIESTPLAPPTVNGNGVNGSIDHAPEPPTPKKRKTKKEV